MQRAMSYLVNVSGKLEHHPDQQRGPNREVGPADVVVQPQRQENLRTVVPITTTNTTHELTSEEASRGDTTQHNTTNEKSYEFSHLKPRGTPACGTNTLIP